MPLRMPPALTQTVLCVAAFLLLALWPPQHGPMLLIPLGGTLATTINIAASGHAALLGPGPFPGSMVIFGDRGRVRVAIGGKAIMLMAATPAGCGSFTADGWAP